MNKKYLGRYIQKYTQAAIYINNLKWDAIWIDPINYMLLHLYIVFIVFIMFIWLLWFYINKVFIFSTLGFIKGFNITAGKIFIFNTLFKQVY